MWKTWIPNKPNSLINFLRLFDFIINFYKNLPLTLAETLAVSCPLMNLQWVHPMCAWVHPMCAWVHPMCAWVHPMCAWVHPMCAWVHPMCAWVHPMCAWVHPMCAWVHPMCAWVHPMCAWVHPMCAWVHPMCAWVHPMCAWVHSTACVCQVLMTTLWFSQRVATGCWRLNLRVLADASSMY